MTGGEKIEMGTHVRTGKTGRVEALGELNIKSDNKMVTKVKTESEITYKKQSMKRR